MPRNDDIGDLPSLLPDSDEIKGTRKQSSSASVGGNTNRAGGNSNNEGADGSSRRGGRDSGRPIASPRAMQPSSPQVVAKNNGILWVLVVTMFFGVLAGGYWSYNKLTDVDLLLMVSRGELDHARKRIGELEALVVATDVNSNKSGTVVQAQVRLVDNRAKERNKFVDTEIDKLWGVAYRNNRPAIEENQKAIDNLRQFLYRLYPNIEHEGETTWQGTRPTLPDSLPMIGRSPKDASIVFAFGSQHLGLTMGPKIGQIVRDIVLDKPSNIKIDAYSPSRFD